MKKIPSFKMKVEEIFNFSDGKSIITGQVGFTKESLTPCQVELWIDDNLIKTIELLSERMPGPMTPVDQRNFEANCSIKIEKEIINAGRCTLIHK